MECRARKIKRASLEADQDTGDAAPVERSSGASAVTSPCFAVQNRAIGHHIPISIHLLMVECLNLHL